MFRGDYGFLSSMGGPQYIYTVDPPRSEKFTDARSHVHEQFHKGVVFKFTPFQGGRIDEEMRFIPEHVPAPTLRGANIQKPGHAAGCLDVTMESERTGVSEEDIIEFFMEAPHMKRKVGFEYILVDKHGNPVPWGETKELVPESELPPPQPKEAAPVDRYIQQKGKHYYCILCEKTGEWRGHRGHERSKAHQQAKQAKEAA